MTDGADAPLALSPPGKRESNHVDRPLQLCLLSAGLGTVDMGRCCLFG